MKLKSFSSSLNFILSFAVFASGFFSLNSFTFAQAFQDVPPTHPHYVSIAFFQSEGVIQGYADGNFLPQNPVNRAENAKILFNALGVQAPEVTQPAFKDIQVSDWYNRFVAKGKELGIIKGRPDGSFDGVGQVNQVEMLAMLFRANQIDVSPYNGPNWYDGYLNYARALGIFPKDMLPDHPLNRGELMEAMYLFTLLTKEKDVQFLLSQAEAQMTQIEIYVVANRVDLAKKASGLAVNITQQALNVPEMRENASTLGVAKLAWAYDQLVQAYVLALENRYDEAAMMVNLTITEATKAWQADNNTQPIASHIKDRACQVYWQLPQPLTAPEHADCLARK